MSDPSIRPPLKWAGGKRWQLRYIRPLWQPHATARLVEPFCGGLAIALGLRPSRALLNDVNPHLVNFYAWLKKGLTITCPMVNDSKTYYANRARFNELLRDGNHGTSEAAGLFYYLNRTGYNGLCRFSRSSGFNVPFGRYSAIAYRRSFDEYADVLAAWRFTSADFATLKLGRRDFVYADPPYDVPFTQYSQGGFDWNEQVRAATWLSKHPGPVVLSNQATSRVSELYADLGFTLTFLEAPRRISCNGDRTPAREVLATRNVDAPRPGARSKKESL